MNSTAIKGKTIQSRDFNLLTNRARATAIYCSHLINLILCSTNFTCRVAKNNKQCVLTYYAQLNNCATLKYYELPVCLNFFRDNVLSIWCKLFRNWSSNLKIETHADVDCLLLSKCDSSISGDIQLQIAGVSIMHGLKPMDMNGINELLEWAFKEYIFDSPLWQLYCIGTTIVQLFVLSKFSEWYNTIHAYVADATRVGQQKWVYSWRTCGDWRSG